MLNNWTLQISDKEIRDEYKKDRIENYNKLFYPIVTIAILRYIYLLIKCFGFGYAKSPLILEGWELVLYILWGIGKFKVLPCFTEMILIWITSQMVVLMLQLYVWDN